ncbi:MAG: DUF2188 domain-containing protein [Candidatus Gracilibacteria bacterium]|jgi:hypothetical protein
MKKILLPRRDPNNPQVREYVDALKRGYASQHVLFFNSGWVVKKPGSARATKFFSTKRAAVSYGKEIAKNKGTGLFIHSKDGRIQERFN